MSYGLNIELIGQSAIFKKQWKVRVKKKNYTGAVIYRNVPSVSPFILKKDSAGIIRGTSFQFMIRSIVDFEFIDLFTNDSKEYLIELLNGSNTIVWQGYILPEQYQEDYKPAPNVVSFMASDQIGLLKFETYLSDKSRKTLLKIISECLALTGLSLGYSISLDISESRQTVNRSVLSEIEVNASIFNGKTCYEVIESILGGFDASITQDGLRWLISDSYKAASRIYYASDCTFENVGSAFVTGVLGQLGNSGTNIYPIGSPLGMSMATSFKVLRISDEYGLKPDMLPASTEDAWTSPYVLPGWTSYGPARLMGYKVDKEFLIWLTAAASYANYGAGLRTTIDSIQQTNEEMKFSFDFSSLTDDLEATDKTQRFRIRIYIVNGPAIQSLSTSGWKLGANESILVEHVAPGTSLKTNFATFSIAFSGIPITGRLYIEISTPVFDYIRNNPVGLLLKNFSLMQLNAGSQPSQGEIRVITLNKSTSAQTKELALFASDIPDTVNNKLVYTNYTSLLDGTLTGQWITPNISATSLLNVLTAIYASNNRKAKQILKGTIRGENISFDQIVQVNYPYTRTFEFSEFSYDLIADLVDVTLHEILPYSGSVSYTLGSEPGTTASNSASKLDQGTVQSIASKQYFHGFEDKTTSVLSFNNTTKTFTITGTDFAVWNKGNKLTKNTESKQSTFFNGVFTWYYYYDSANSDAFTLSTDPWNRNNDIPVAIVEWNGTSGTVKDMRYTCYNINHILINRYNDLAHPAEDLYTNTSKFIHLFSPEEVTVQKALDKIDYMLQIRKVPFTSAEFPAINNYQTTQTDPNDSAKTINYAEIYGNDPNVRCIIVNDATRKFQRQQMPQFDIVNGELVRVWFDFNGESVSGYLIISRS